MTPPTPPKPAAKEADAAPQTVAGYVSPFQSYYFHMVAPTDEIKQLTTYCGLGYVVDTREDDSGSLSWTDLMTAAIPAIQADIDEWGASVNVFIYAVGGKQQDTLSLFATIEVSGSSTTPEEDGWRLLTRQGGTPPQGVYLVFAGGHKYEVASTSSLTIIDEGTP